MKNYSVITASAQTDFDYPAGFVKSVVTSDFSHFVTKSPAINKKPDMIETKNNDTNIQYKVVPFKGS